MGNLGRAGYGASLEGMVRISGAASCIFVVFAYRLHSFSISVLCNSCQSCNCHVVTVRRALHLTGQQWPYTYDSCDVGTVKNQTVGGLPAAATVDGDKGKGGVLSYLPGQRLSRCTCDGESHPGPKHQDGSYVGRSAPEIDVFEAQIDQNTLVAQVSQSAQWAVRT